MNVIVEEWIKKAEGDWHSAARELRARKNPNYDAACFHAQQCAEKYLKAFLQSKNQRFAKTHNLIELLELSLRHETAFELFRDILSLLNQYSVLYRYPGEEASKLEASEAVKALKQFRNFVRDLLKMQD
jgi:HEPN domain-containing protein